jgi:poly [ADP-ribose] polymerase
LRLRVFFWLTGDFCSDAAAEAGRYGFTAVDRPEGFLALAVASLGDQVIKVESPLEVC